MQPGDIENRIDLIFGEAAIETDPDRQMPEAAVMTVLGNCVRRHAERISVAAALEEWREESRRSSWSAETPARADGAFADGNAGVPAADAIDEAMEEFQSAYKRAHTMVWNEVKIAIEETWPDVEGGGNDAVRSALSALRARLGLGWWG